MSPGVQAKQVLLAEGTARAEARSCCVGCLGMAKWKCRAQEIKLA